MELPPPDPSPLNGVAQSSVAACGRRRRGKGGGDGGRAYGERGHPSSAHGRCRLWGIRRRAHPWGGGGAQAPSSASGEVGRRRERDTERRGRKKW